MTLRRNVVAYICSAQSENLDNSGIAPRKVRIPKLADRVRIHTLRGTIPELSMRKVRIGTKWESYIRNMFAGKIDMEQRFPNFYKVV